MADQPTGIPKARPGPIDWLSVPMRRAIEESVSRRRGADWRIEQGLDYSEFACHRCAILSDGSFDIFFKYSHIEHAARQFEVELAGLETLAGRAGVLVPRPIGVVAVDGGTILVMEAVKAIERGPTQWREIGTALATIHEVEGSRHGYEEDGFWGPLHQVNTPSKTWSEFFRDRRLAPLLRAAIDSGHLPASVASRVERVMGRLPELCGPERTPRLLHGDAQQNNFISTAREACVIDPAVHFGNPEFDLAMVDSWQPVPEDLFDGYREALPIDPGFAERRGLWRIPLYLAAVALEGEMHLERLTDVLGTCD